MFSLSNTEIVVRLLYIISRLSGFVVLSVDFSSKEPKVIGDGWNFLLFIISLLLSFYANFHQTYIPIADVVHSKLLEIGVNITLKGLPVVILVIKVDAFLRRNELFFILKTIHALGDKVSLLK